MADLHPQNMGFIGFTGFRFSQGQFLANTAVTVEDPTEAPVVPLPDGDLQYAGSSTTIFQDFIHEMGHSIDLDHNTSDPTSVMTAVLSAANPVPDAQDIAAIQSVYGAPTSGLALNSTDATTLHKLVANTSMAGIA